SATDYILFFHRPPPTALYTLSLHDALPIYTGPAAASRAHPTSPMSIRRVDILRIESTATVVTASAAGSCQSRKRIRPALSWYPPDRKSTRLNSSHSQISYAVFCLKKKK